MDFLKRLALEDEKEVVELDRKKEVAEPKDGGESAKTLEEDTES